MQNIMTCSLYALSIVIQQTTGANDSTTLRIKALSYFYILLLYVYSWTFWKRYCSYKLDLLLGTNRFILPVCWISNLVVSLNFAGENTEKYRRWSWPCTKEYSPKMTTTGYNSLLFTGSSVISKLDELGPLVPLLSASLFVIRFRKLYSLTAKVRAYTAVHVRRSAAHKISEYREGKQTHCHIPAYKWTPQNISKCCPWISC